MLGDEAKHNLELAVFVANQFMLTSDSSVRVMDDTTLEAEDLAGVNLVIVGTPWSLSLIHI